MYDLLYWACKNCHRYVGHGGRLTVTLLTGQDGNRVWMLKSKCAVLPKKEKETRIGCTAEETRCGITAPENKSGGFVPATPRAIPHCSGKHLLQRTERSWTNICMTAKTDGNEYPRSLKRWSLIRDGATSVCQCPVVAHERTADWVCLL